MDDSRCVDLTRVRPGYCRVFWMASIISKLMLGLTCLGELETTLRQETSSSDFSELPDDYLEVSKALLEVFVCSCLACDRSIFVLTGLAEY